MHENLQYYSGELGTFYYNANIFTVDSNDSLRYIETKKIRKYSELVLPEGLVYGNGVFMGMHITFAPTLPKSLRNCTNMFWYCNFLEEAPILPLNVENATSMFAGCNNLQQTPIFNHKLKTASFMFNGCLKLTYSFDLSKEIVNCKYMFADCTSLEIAPKISNPENCDSMFKGCIKLKVAPEIIPDSVLDCTNMFAGCADLVKAPRKIPRNAKCAGMFAACYSLEYPPDELPHNTNCDKMFAGCKNLKYIPTIHKDVLLSTKHNMFMGCSEEIQAIGKVMIKHRGMTFEEAKARIVKK